jgi:hypothetical protein
VTECGAEQIAEKDGSSWRRKEIVGEISRTVKKEEIQWKDYIEKKKKHQELSWFAEWRIWVQRKIQEACCQSQCIVQLTSGN